MQLRSPAPILSLCAGLMAAVTLAGCSSMEGLNIKPAPAVVVSAAVEADDPMPTMAYVAAPSRPAGGVDRLIARYAALYDVPESLIRRVIVRESGYNAAARNGSYYGLMQIHYGTARSMGYNGSASGLLDADTNLRYAVKYLRGAYISADRDPDRAMRYYATGYYFVAKHKGLLDEIGL